MLKSFWVRPGLRRNGIARRFAAYARDLGLPAYLAFASKNVEQWFNREFRPTKRLSPLQRKITKAIGATGTRYMPEDDPDFTIFLQAEAAYTRRSCFAAGTIDGWIIELDAICASASVRHFLRTLKWREYTDVNDAVRELFVRDLRDEPRGLRSFSTLVSPIYQSSV